MRVKICALCQRKKIMRRKMSSDFPLAAPIISEALKSYLSNDFMSVSECAAKYRYLNNRGGGHVGLWKHSIAPYLCGPMDALSDERFLSVAVVGPARSGKTEIGRNWMMQSILTDPADFLVYAQGDDQIKSMVRDDVNPFLMLHNCLTEKQSTKREDDSLFHKKFLGMSINFWAATYNNLIGKTAPRIILTELDAIERNGEKAFRLASERRVTFGSESTVYAESHPDLADGITPTSWNRGIMSLYRDSDRRLWYWACPECGLYSSPTPGAVREMTLHYDETLSTDEIRQTARLLCPCCGALIEDKQRKDMNLTGVWVAAGQEISPEGKVTGDPIKKDTAGFWITGIMSPFLMHGIGGLAESLEKAKLKFKETGDDEELKITTVKTGGVPYTPPASARRVDADALAMREDPSLQLGKVPDGVRFLTAAMDIQGNRFELLVRGWGRDGESWIISYQQIKADPSKSQHDWDDVIQRVMNKKWPLAEDPTKGLKILGFGYDSGGQEGVTSQAYAAWRRARKKGFIKKLGFIDGREVITVLPLKGMSRSSSSFLKIVYPDSSNSKKISIRAGDVPLGEFNPNRFKDLSASRLSVLEPGENYVHFPEGLGQLHDFYLQLASEERDITGRWEKRKGSNRNEAWDLLVMTDVMNSVFGGYKMNWDNPPVWAKPLEENILLQTIDPSEQKQKEVGRPSEVVNISNPVERDVAIRLRKMGTLGKQAVSSQSIFKKPQQKQKIPSSLKRLG
ncbi:phage terminase large subunit family protein [Acetobacteraceae bacterium]|nr:phage terminase large subunit family protein [Acetobacteraceae bacterium]